MRKPHSVSFTRCLGGPATAATLLVTPAVALVSVAILRHLQPSQYEPARTALRLFEWAGSWMSPPLAAVLFLLLPLSALAMGVAVLSAHWRATPAVRSDAMTALAVVRRNAGAIVLAAMTLAAAAILALSVLHLIAG